MKVLVIIPAYNEEANIQSVVNDLIENYPQYDYIIINDNSTDQTQKICNDNNFNYVSFPTNLGIGGGVQAGYKYALENGYDIAVQHDGDGQHDPYYIADVIKPIINNESDIVVGSRFINNEGFQSSTARRFGINFLSRLIKLCSGARVSDVTSGFRAVNRKYISYYANNYPQDYPEPEAIVMAKLMDARIKEIPVIMRERANGVSSINFGKSIYYMIKVSIAIVICRLTEHRRK